MALRVITSWLLLSAMATAVIVDRIAVVVGNHIVKQSDIEREIRVTAFLNDENADLSLTSRKKAAGRLIDQLFIRREIELGDYPTANLQQAE